MSDAMELMAQFNCAENGNPLGAWDVTCATCPLLPHLLALGEKPRTCCIAGIQTNAQGMIPLKYCKHYVMDSVSINDQLVIRCTKGANRE